MRAGSVRIWASRSMSWDYGAEFERRVVDDFVDTYLAGETPNPCVRCNQHIKFTPLLQRARALGAETLATGHYARIERGEDGEYQLRRGLDRGKDQSYFLFPMPRESLRSVIFPLGGLTKDEVRERADSFSLPNAQKAESQEICFVPDGDYAGFVERRAGATGRELPKAGAIEDLAGKQVGTHTGVHHFTVGQRRGLGAVGGGEPAYVVNVDRLRQRVVVGPAIRGGRPRNHGRRRAVVDAHGLRRASGGSSGSIPANTAGGDGDAHRRGRAVPLYGAGGRCVGAGVCILRWRHSARRRLDSPLTRARKPENILY